MDGVELLFLGTGTSAGVPMIGCKCDVCTSEDPRDSRNRCSVVISYDGLRVLVDTTPELRIQCLQHGIDWIDALVFTHAHADHIMGLDDIRRFNAIREGSLDVWADAPTHASLTRCFEYAFREPDPQLRVFRPHLVRRTIDGPFTIGSRTWQPVPLLHGAGHTLGFRIGDLAYCTDVSEIPDTSYPLLEGVHTLVLDGLQWKKHPTHFTIEEAIEAARRVGAAETWLTHLSHGVRHADTQPQLPPGVQLAYDGLIVRVPHPKSST